MRDIRRDLQAGVSANTGNEQEYAPDTRGDSERVRDTVTVSGRYNSQKVGGKVKKLNGRNESKILLSSG